MRASAPIHPKGSYHLKSKVLSLSEHPIHPKHVRGWVMPWLAEEMMDGLHQRVGISAHASPALKGLLQKGLEEDLC